MVRPAPTSRAKVAAVTTLLLGLLFLGTWRGVDEAAGYLGLTSAVIVGASVVAAQRLWFGGHLEGRVLACVLCVVAFAGGLLNVSVGLPGAPSLHESIGPPTWVAFALEVVSVWLVVSDGLRRSREDKA